MSIAQCKFKRFQFSIHYFTRVGDVGRMKMFLDRCSRLSRNCHVIIASTCTIQKALRLYLGQLRG